MSVYQSLYRTWRPHTFSDMVGQEAIVRTLKNQVQSKRVAHAYLFCGSRGTGKTSAARIMAMAINCLEPIAGDPCLKCAHCQALQSETTLDVFEMDAASNSRVEEIREMLSRTDYPPQTVPYKVYIIDEVHMLSNAAFNALLKTLEEPPEYMVFILATTEPQKLPATILSRCQRYDFGRIAEEEIIRRLMMALPEGAPVDQDALRLIAATAQGSMRDAWSLMDMCLSAGGALQLEQVRLMLGAVSQDFLFDFLDALVRQDSAATLAMADELMRAGRDVPVFLREFNAHLRQVLAIKWTGGGTRDLGPEQLERFKAQAQDASADLLLFFLEKCAQSEYEARWSASPRAVLELFALRCIQPGQARGEQATLARLGALEGWVARQEASDSGQLQPAREPAPLPVPPKQVTTGPATAGPVQPDSDTATPPPDREAAASQAEPPAAAAPAPSAPALQEPPAQAQLPLQANPPSQPAKNPKDAWNSLLKRLQTGNAGLHAMMSRGKYGGYESGTFTLLLEQEDLIFASLLNEETRADEVTAILTEELGAPARFVAKGRETASAAALADRTQEHIQALSQAFGRDNIVLKND